MNSYNVLLEWKKQMYYETSPFSIEKRVSFNRDNVDFIYNCFLDFFGLEYFNVDRVKYVKEPFAFLERNIVFQLLNSASHNAFYQILEWATLISYCKKLDEGLYAKLLSVKEDLFSLRDYLFEVFTYRMFSGNHITFLLKPIIKGKELEAILRFKGEDCLVECKKLYSTERNRQSHLQYMLTEFFKRWLDLQFNVFAFIFSPSKDEDRLSEEKNSFSKWLDEYVDLVKEKQDYDFVFERHNSQGGVVLHIEKSKTGLFEHLQQITKEPHAYFSVYPPSFRKRGEANYFRFINGYFFTVGQEEIEKKIINEIKKKRNQHKNAGFKYRIFFFENEATNNGEMPLITPKILNSSLIQDYINAKESNDIICIINKNFFPHQPAKFDMQIFCKPEFSDIKEALERMELKYFHA